MLVTVGAADVADAVVEKLPERWPVTVDVIVMDPDRYVTVAVPGGVVSVSVALSVAESMPVRVVVARVMVVAGTVALGGVWEVISWVPVRMMMPDASEVVDSDADADFDVAAAPSSLVVFLFAAACASVLASVFASLFAAWASEPRPRSNSPHSLKGAIVEAQ